MDTKNSLNNNKFLYSLSLICKHSRMNKMARETKTSGYFALYIILYEKPLYIMIYTEVLN